MIRVGAILLPLRSFIICLYTTIDKLVLFTYTIKEEMKLAWYLIVKRLYIESAIFSGSERGSFRKYNRRTLKGVAVIYKSTPRGRSQADFFDAENINGPILKQGLEMA